MSSFLHRRIPRQILVGQDSGYSTQMRLKVEINQAHERWRKLAERATSLHAASKQLRDNEPKPAIAFATKTTALLAEITEAAVSDLDNDADELDLLAYLRDPDVVSALTTAGPRLRDLWLFMSLKGYGLQRKHVKAVITGYATKLQTLRGRTLRVLRAIEKLRTAEAKPKRTLGRSGATKATKDEMATRYSNLERVGEGAYGEVWRADDQKLGRKVALKFIRSTDADQAALAHAKALARVQHPNIVTVHEVHAVKDPVTGLPAYAVVMELVEGPALDRRLGHAMSAAEVSRIGNAILSALAAYHHEGLAHLDLHDGNVIVGDHVVKVIDPLYLDTAAFASTSGRQKQQGRDVRQARDLLVQMLHLGAVSIDVAQRFERETAQPSIDLLRQKLQEALQSSSTDEGEIAEDKPSDDGKA